MRLIDADKLIKDNDVYFDGDKKVIEILNEQLTVNLFKYFHKNVILPINDKQHEYFKLIDKFKRDRYNNGVSDAICNVLQEHCNDLNDIIRNIYDAIYDLDSVLEKNEG